MNVAAVARETVQNMSAGVVEATPTAEVIKEAIVGAIEKEL